MIAPPRPLVYLEFNFILFFSSWRADIWLKPAVFRPFWLTAEFDEAVVAEQS